MALYSDAQAVPKTDSHAPNNENHAFNNHMNAEASHKHSCLLSYIFGGPRKLFFGRCGVPGLAFESLAYLKALVDLLTSNRI